MGEGVCDGQRYEVVNTQLLLSTSLSMNSGALVNPLGTVIDTLGGTVFVIVDDVIHNSW